MRRNHHRRSTRPGVVVAYVQQANGARLILSLNSRGMANVPFYVQGLPDGRTKAIFSVPESLLSTLVLHPVLCRGGVFRLQMDMASQKLMRAVSVKGEESVGFLSTEYESPDPEATALAIAHRLENRVDEAHSANHGTSLSMSSYFKFL